MTDQELIQRIVDAALLRGEFTLRSGRKSNYYLDKYLFETQPAILAEIGKRFGEKVQAIGGVQRVAGAELGGIPLVTATSLATGLPSVLVRNKKKDYGTNKQMEGRLEAGDKIVIVEDVVTTGGQTLEAAQVLKEAGADVVKILVVLDRQEGARGNIEGAGFPMESLLTKSDLGMDE
jgi:orotate phosphoribosyltransferase